MRTAFDDANEPASVVSREEEEKEEEAIHRWKRAIRGQLALSAHKRVHARTLGV